MPRWQRWAAEDRRLRPIFEVYKRLFDVEQLSNQFGEQYEIVVGIGLLTWSGQTGAIRRHLLTVPADLRFDAETGRISLGQPADGARPRLEEDMVQGDRLPGRGTGPPSTGCCGRGSTRPTPAAPTSPPWRRRSAPATPPRCTSRPP